MAVAANAGHPFGLRDTRQAVLVIHGMGEQNPYDTLDSFARGLFSHFRGQNHAVRLCPLEIAHKDWTQIGMRIGFFTPPRPEMPPCPGTGEHAAHENEPAAYIDVFEYYWAPETKGKLSATDTLNWLLHTDLTPLHYFADNLQEMIFAQHMGRARAFWEALKLYSREILRTVLLYLPLAVGIGLLLGWLAGKHDWSTALKTLVPSLRGYITLPHGFILLFYLLFLLTAWFALQAFNECRRYPGAAIETEGDKVWFGCNTVLGIVSLAIALLWDFHSRSYVIWHVPHFLLRNGRWMPLVGAALAWAVTYALTDYVGDVAVYTNMDAKSKNYDVRNKILSGSTLALKQLLGNPAYDRVTLAGHSLGSVIAYDTINELLGERNAAPGPGDDHPAPALHAPDLLKLKGLATFGSPLDKVYYFFREHVKRDQAIRAQVLSMLHSFRRGPSGRDYGEFAFNYSFNQLDPNHGRGLVWINAWACMDPVSARLKFYRVDHQRKFSYCTPLLAHLRYWSDPAFYDYFASRLL